MSKTNLYVCGDSFCSRDPEYGMMWVDFLQQARPDLEIVNLATPGASNYLISLQVQQALKNNCDYLIYHATSSIRNEFSLVHESTATDSVDRYWSPHDRNNKTVVSNSWHRPTHHTSDLLTQKEKLIKHFFAELVDFPSIIMKNYMLIDYSLRLIVEQLPQNKWAWSRGGFEHKNFINSPHAKFNASSTLWDFSRYQSNHCSFNLWDNFDAKLERPYFHVPDEKTQKNLSDTYIAMLGL